MKTILSEKREVLDRLARLLSEKESVEGDQLRRMLSESGHQMVN
jgi:ATP-dependent Zn protease